MLKKPGAIIFDLDGVLTDTSEYHYQAWKHLADDEGIPFTHEENDEHLRGVSRRESLMYIIRGRQYSEDHMSPNDLVPGGRALLQDIRDAGIKVAIGSGSKNCRMVLDLLQITDLLDGIADGNSVVNGKPAPDLFVYAAGLVNVPVAECLGVEDADAGIDAIKSAGMQALAIGPQERFHRADKVMPTLANKHLQDLLD